ncbi:MAG: hypothetical protein LUD68_04290 [Rikenellaceae bacterium]|nr:hypothetical protein [Rikenellaceae bacterium]
MTSSSAGFELDKDVIITTETLRISPEWDSVDLEVELKVNTPEIHSGRSIEFRITDVRGAAAGNTTCRIDLIETYFVEGRYEIKGLSIGDGSAATGSFLLSTLDDTMDQVRMDFGIGAQATVRFIEIVPKEEYDMEIDPFQFIGVYSGLEVYLTWAKQNQESTDPDTVERFNGIFFDRTRPIRGKFTRTLEDGRETSAVIVMEDVFALLGTVAQEPDWWFNNYRPGAVLTKDQ